MLLLLHMDRRVLELQRMLQLRRPGEQETDGREAVRVLESIAVLPWWREIGSMVSGELSDLDMLWYWIG